jgi:glycosyltransferase involved in cell wall biosynthesis
MIKIIVVLPAYKAEKTLLATLIEIPFDIVDDVILVEDCSSDKTIENIKNDKGDSSYYRFINPTKFNKN